MAKEKSKAKKIIIPVVAVVLAAALIVTGYFCLYKPKHGGTNEYGGGSDTKKSVELTPEKVSYETADYKGYKLPEFFVEIFEQAEKDSEAACEKYGVAMTVGDRKISATEFAMTYFDMFIYAASDEIGDPQGLTPELTAAPADQPYGKDEKVTWADRLKEETQAALRKRYILFYDALENGFMISDSVAAELSSIKGDVEYSADMNAKNPDAMLSESYCEGTTVCLYARNLIMRNYASEYEKALKSTFAAAHSDSEIKGIYDKNPSKYNYIDVRVLKIYSDDEEGAQRAKKEIKDLESFYDFGIDYYKDVDPHFSRIADSTTRYYFCLYDRIVEDFGSETAEWCFAKGRKAGDVEVLPGDTYANLVYVEKPQYSPDSVNYRESITLFNAGGQAAQSDDEKKESEAAAKRQYDLLKRNDGSVEMMEEISDTYNESFQSWNTVGVCEGVHIHELGYSVARWMTAAERKAGDYEVLESGVGYGLFMYEGTNEGDIDAYSLIRLNLAAKEYNEYYESLLNFNGNKAVTFGAVIEKAAQKGEKSSAAFAEKRLQRVNDAQAQAEAQTAQ
ncbi:MAG: hypothetical protein IJK60_00860 [Clostridia bacterium]|nr:hypothetical protein [Clostridia bacterium]